MRLSIQRQCDGPATHLVCDQRLELAVEVPDPITVEASKQWTDAWEAAAAKLGWRRSGPGETIVMQELGRAIGVRGEQPIIPSTKTWVVCPACAKTMGLAPTGELDAVFRP